MKEEVEKKETVTKITEEKLKEEIEEKNKQIKELTSLLKRVQADFENFRKRTEKEKAEIAKMATAQLISRFLPFFDDFELALKNTHNGEEFIKGMKMLYASLHTLFRSFGVQPINALNQPFDPHVHEVLMVEENDKEDLVLEEFQKGYLLDGMVLRTSKVKLGKKKK